LVFSSFFIEEVSQGSRILDIGCGPCDLTAILSKLGFDLTGVDDLRDQWHLIGTNRKRIKEFANKMGIKLAIEPIESVNLEEESFDAVLLLDILEHSAYPRFLLNRAISAIKPGGLLFIETPNSSALAKRILVSIGRTSFPDVDFTFFNVGMYRGHIREYNRFEVNRILELSGLTEVKIKLANIATSSLICKQAGIKKAIFKFYDSVSKIYPGFMDTILARARKSEDWRPIDDSKAIKNFKRHYENIVAYNLDNEPDDVLVRKFSNSFGDTKRVEE
jgi:SAM-dependent methyltransferase